MDHIFSPWRMSYIQGHKHDQNCVFCQALEITDGVGNLIIARFEYSFVILNRFPYTSGHLLIIPYAHQPSLESLDRETRGEIMELTVMSMQVLRKEYSPQGFNIGINIGEVAGAGIVDHVHLHVVPRWGGDTNFMSALSQTRVLPEALEETYQRLKNIWPTEK